MVLQRGHERPRFRGHGSGRAFANRGLNLLFRFGDHARDLARQMQRRIAAWQRQDANIIFLGLPFFLFSRRGSFKCHPFRSRGRLDLFGRRRNFEIGGCFREGKPIRRRESDAPNVAGNFEFHTNLKQFANGSRALNPRDARADGARLAPRFIMRHLERDPHIFQDVMFGLIPATVAINDQAGSAFLKRPAQGVYARHGKRHGLDNPRRPPLLRLWLRMKIRFH